MIRIITILSILLLTGCATSKSVTHQAILDWQTEGHYVYKTVDNKEYFVRCTAGQKFVGYWIPDTGFYRAYGPMGTCNGEEE